MKRLLFAGPILVIIVLFGYFAFAGYASLFGFHTRLSGAALGVVRRPPPSPVKGEVLRSFPDTSSDGQVDLRADDLTSLDLRALVQELLLVQFDSNTSWPPELPDSFSPQRVLEMGKNPGLGIRALHEHGITGRGVSVAIVDQTLLVDHSEYGNRVALYEEIHNFDTAAKAHGPMVASILVGKTTGVAPAADLYYIASSHWNLTITGIKTTDYTWTAEAIERLLEINETLPPEKKIRVISISKEWSQGELGFDDVIAAARRARDAGVMVVSVSIDKYYPFDYGGLGRDPLADPGQPDSYEAPLFTGGFSPAENRLFVPIDSRTYASHAGSDVYTFERRGGYSHGAPYIAGLYALACQVKPEITPEQFWEQALATAGLITVKIGDREEQVQVVNPVALIASLQDGSQGAPENHRYDKRHLP